MSDPREDDYLEQVAEARAEDRRNYTPPLRGWDALLAKRNAEWAAEHARTHGEDRRTA